jgi:hypothetical protein
MTLLFGNLIQEFITFTRIIYQADNNVPDTADQIFVVAAHFRQASGKLAIYLVCLGACLDHQSSKLEFNSVIRHRNVPLHVRLHVCVGVYQ